ncbi:MAG: fused MFS/spermidine synthase [Chloroflexi bacterium]|nr:fused MFS/spermidine synthase [Chloroflexota bacterium]
MQTNLQDPTIPPAEPSAAPAAAPSPFRERPVMLRTIVVVAGAASLGAEMCASRLLEPYFGTSLFVWANIIGLILLYLTVGYYAGGRIADRFPRAHNLYFITGVAGAALVLIPVVARPILLLSLNAFATYSVGAFAGSLLGTIILFSVPVTLLGCVSPFAIRLALRQIERAGNVAGGLYALSTIGSIVGTFLSVLVLIPTIGTARTLISLGLVLLIVSAIGFGRRWPWMVVIAGLVLLLLPPAVIKPEPGMMTELESPYNFIQVIQDHGVRLLLLNEGIAIHSVYNPASEGNPNPLAHLTRAYWDYVLVAPYFNPLHPLNQVRKAAIIGMGAGTMAKELSYFYPGVPIDGVEIDPSIIAVGRKYFDLHEPNVHAIAQDGRYFLRTTHAKYDLISVDAYHTPYIPFQLTTVEFFREVEQHLTPDGSVVINVGRTARDQKLVDDIARTMSRDFASIYLIDVPSPSGALILNTLIVGNNSPASLSALTQRMKGLDNPVLASLGISAVTSTAVYHPTSGLVFTDDHAPVEQVVDNMIIDYLRTRN